MFKNIMDTLTQVMQKQSKASQGTNLTFQELDIGEKTTQL